MTERGSSSAQRDAASLAIGPSALAWDGTALTIRVAETTAPIPSRLRGTVRLIPGAVTGPEFALDPAGRHRWWPIAPAARIEVAFDEPRLAWSGAGYFDTNGGDAPLERDFSSWHWCRAPLGRGAGIVYEAACREGPGAALALRCDPTGAVEAEPLPPPAALPRTRLWRVERPTRADPGASPTVAATLEDTPFYARSTIATRLFGEAARGVHESLSLDRFRRPVVQAMLACRIPRRA